MIHTNRTVTVGNQESIIDNPIILYRGDREVEVEFTLNGNKFTFTNDGNVIKSTNATHGQLVINTPTGENMFSDMSACNEGKVVFLIKKEMIDELIEIGFYSFQIRLFDESQVSRVTIPPVYQGIDIRNPIAAEDETDLVDIGLVDYSVVRKDDYEGISTFLPNGDYNKTLWEEHDVISSHRLNKVEDALYEINKSAEELYPTLRNQYDEFSSGVNAEVKAYKEETEYEIEQFEREITQQWGEFKVDYRDEVHDSLYDIQDSLYNIQDRLEDTETRLSPIAINVMSYGAIGDGVTDDTDAIQKAINDLPYTDVLKTLIFPQGYTFKCNINVTIPHLVISGGGTIVGTMVININNSYANLHIKDLSFKDGGHIEYRACRGGSISRCTFHDTDIAIKMKAEEGQDGQSIARIRIEHNSFENVEYDLLCESIKNNDISIADIHFTNNMCKWAKVSHIDIATMDGAIISGNTFFCSRSSETYHHIIVRKWSNWFIINNNNLFESGHESIYLTNSENYNISNNNLAWCGRYVRCAAIKIDGLSSEHQSYGSINNNNINVPSNTGIEITNSSYINIKNNNIALDNEQQDFKGIEELNLDKFYGVYTDNNCSAISVDNLVNKINRHRNPSSVHFRINKHDFIDLENVNTVDGNYDEIRLTANTTIESIQNGYIGQVVRIYVLANLVTIKSNSTIFLRGNVDAKLKRRDIIELMYKDGVWIEKSRNEMNKNNVKSLQHSDNSTLDVSNDEGIVIFTNNNDIPINTINGSYEGQQVTIISSGDKNKIEHNVTLKNRDAQTILIPNGRSITFIKYNNTWYEAGRSF